MWGCGKNIESLLALLFVMIVQGVAGCTGVSGNHQPPALAISCNSLPSGKVQTAYSATLAASGGTTPYSWSISSGSLPGGLTLSAAGTISGTPTTAADFSFTVKVSDSGSPASTALANFSITIAATYSAVLSWVASASSDVTGYNVYRSTVSGSGYVKINSSLIAGSTYTDATLVNGKTYYYVITSVDASGVESTYSNEVPAVIP